MNQETHRNLISGHASGAGASVARLLLAMLSWPYSLVVRLRNGLFSLGVLRARKVGAVVISVGNLTTGGTGKTPLVVWLCQSIRQKGCRCAILTRGYRMQKGGLSDEPAVLAARCPDVSVVVNPDRVAGANQAIGTDAAQVLVLDDGFQHRRLARDVDIVAVDATAPFGYGRLLPAGLLREPVSGLRRAHAVVITRSDQVSEPSLLQIESRIRQINPQAVIAAAVHAPVGAASHGDAEIGLEELRGRKVFAFCGLGNPQAFFDTIRRMGCSLVGSVGFDDHHPYSDQCLRRICGQARDCRTDFILTTHKDWTKISQFSPPEGSPTLAYLAIELRLTAGAEQLTALIERVLDGRIPSLQGPG